MLLSFPVPSSTTPPSSTTLMLSSKSPLGSCGIYGFLTNPLKIDSSLVYKLFVRSWVILSLANSFLISSTKSVISLIDFSEYCPAIVPIKLFLRISSILFRVSLVNCSKYLVTTSTGIKGVFASLYVWNPDVLGILFKAAVLSDSVKLALPEWYFTGVFISS